MSDSTATVTTSNAQSATAPASNTASAITVATPPTPTPQPPPTPPANESPNGFPENTPLAEMTTEEQMRYWKHQARRHESTWQKVIDKNLTPDQILEMQSRLNEAERASLSDQERAVAEARDAGKADARQELAIGFARTLLETHLLFRGKTPEQATDLVAMANLAALTTDGEADAAKVTAYADTLAGANTNPHRPDMGQGARGTAFSSTGVKAGADLFDQRNAKKQ